jgi:3-oxoacyl-ACP reductase-like protein
MTNALKKLPYGANARSSATFFRITSGLPAIRSGCKMVLRFSYARGAIHSDGRSLERGVASGTMANMNRLSNKVAIVTGASKGIGGGIATALGAAGARVAVNYSSDREGAERVAQAITGNGGEAIAVGADVSKAADVVRLFKEVDSAFG